MKNSIKDLPEKEAKKILIDFIDIYLNKGFGVMNKTEIETLLYHVLKKHQLLSGKCFDDSFKLQIPESKARKLIYESQVKYETKTKDDLDLYLRKSIGNCLASAKLVKNNKEIKFAIEDKYLRVALNAKLRENNFFADTSFNKDIVSLDSESFINMVSLLVPNDQKEKVLEKLTEIKLSDETKNMGIKEILHAFITEAMVQGSIAGISQIASLLSTAL